LVKRLAKKGGREGGSALNKGREKTASRIKRRKEINPSTGRYQTTAGVTDGSSLLVINSRHRLDTYIKFIHDIIIHRG
jgi:hypothetical protein